MKNMKYTINDRTNFPRTIGVYKISYLHKNYILIQYQKNFLF